MEVIVGRKGNQPFVITDRSVSSKHLKLTLLDDNNVLVEDLGSSNGTFIDNVRIVKKKVSRSTKVRMGQSFSFCINDVFAESRQSGAGATPPVTPPSVTEYSILHLEKVWDNYEQGIEELTNKNKRINVITRISSVFTIGGGVLGGVLRSMDGLEAVSNISLVASGIGLLIMIYSIIQTISFDFTKEKKNLDEQFEKDYVCPNPQCHHYLGIKKYSILRQDKQCPYCRSKFKS